MAKLPRLFTPFQMKGLNLKNRITMAPLFLGYANPDGTTNALILDHYQEMAASGAAMIVVENVGIEPNGIGSPFTMRIDEERFLFGLTGLAKTIHQQGALAFLQINHAGSVMPTLKEKIAPSPMETYGVVPKEMDRADIDRVVQAYAAAARRVKEAGFDGVEIHGGMGYLLVQFLSSRTNQRTDAYGGSLENRMRFPLQVVEAVMEAVGSDYPVGYRFLADEWLPDGLHLEETAVYARELEKRGVAYLSVMAGTYDSLVSARLFKGGKEGRLHGPFCRCHKKGGSQNTDNHGRQDSVPGNRRRPPGRRISRPDRPGSGASGRSPLAEKGPGSPEGRDCFLRVCLLPVPETGHRRKTGLLLPVGKRAPERVFRPDRREAREELKADLFPPVPA